MLFVESIKEFTIVGNRLQSDNSSLLDYSVSSVGQPARVQEKVFLYLFLFGIKFSLYCIIFHWNSQ